MAALVDIYNAALSAATGRSSLSLPDEETREAEVCNLWFPLIRDQVFRAAFWPCLRANRHLALIKERNFELDWALGDPPDQWRYAYAVPANMLRARFITTYARFELGLYTAAGVEPAESGQYAIFTSQPEAILEYTVRVSNTEIWDADLTMAVIYALAAHIAMPLHGKRAIRLDSLEVANQIIMTARMNAANEQEAQVESVPEWIQARGYWEAAPKQRFFYPYGPLFAASSQVQKGDV